LDESSVRQTQKIEHTLESFDFCEQNSPKGLKKDVKISVVFTQYITHTPGGHAA
jgi:hypothetical protein